MRHRSDHQRHRDHAGFHRNEASVHLDYDLAQSLLYRAPIRHPVGAFYQHRAGTGVAGPAIAGELHELTWEDYSGTYVTGDTGPLGESRHSKKVMIKARIPNFSKMELGLRFSSESGLETSTLFNGNFAKGGGSLTLYDRSEGKSSGSEASDYDISSGNGVYMIERILHLADDAAKTRARLEGSFQGMRARTLRYSDQFKLEFR